MKRKKATPRAEAAAPAIPIREIRGQRVLLDSDLAAIYDVPTFRFNEAIKRNRHRFPEDFMFQLTTAEFDAMNSSQIAMSSTKQSDPAAALTSQFAISKSARGGRRTLPYAFTEHGALQAANILKSERAAAMSVFVIRAFVAMRAELSRSGELLSKLAELEARLTGRLDSHEQAIVHVMHQLVKLLSPPALPPPLPKPKIGFKP